MIRRREFIGLLGGAAAAWPLAAWAQGERARRIGMLLPAAADDLQFQTFVGAFLQGLGLLGWNIGGNVQVLTRWATPNAGHTGAWLRTDGGAAAGDPHAADRVPDRQRSGRRRPRRQPGATGRKRYRVHEF